MSYKSKFLWVLVGDTGHAVPYMFEYEDSPKMKDEYYRIFDDIYNNKVSEEGRKECMDKMEPVLSGLAFVSGFNDVYDQFSDDELAAISYLYRQRVDRDTYGVLVRIDCKGVVIEELKYCSKEMNDD